MYRVEIAAPAHAANRVKLADALLAQFLFALHAAKRLRSFVDHLTLVPQPRAHIASRMSVLSI